MSDQLKKAKAELAKFIEENPKARSYQQVIDEALDRASDGNRLEVIRQLILHKNHELSVALAELVDTIEKVKAEKENATPQ